jgi:hypothetical protein
MSNVDPDVLAVLKALDLSGERKRFAKVKLKQKRRDVHKFADRLETMGELLIDEVEKVLPQSHPLFMRVWFNALLNKLQWAHDQMQQQEPEYKSALDHFPPSW